MSLLNREKGDCKGGYKSYRSINVLTTRKKNISNKNEVEMGLKSRKITISNTDDYFIFIFFFLSKFITARIFCTIL